MKAGETLL